MANMGVFQLMRKKKEAVDGSSIFRVGEEALQLIPLIGFVTFAGVGAILALLNSTRKTDVIFNKSDNPEPWEHVNPSQPQKLLSINQQWKPIEELEEVRKMTK